MIVQSPVVPLTAVLCVAALGQDLTIRTRVPLVVAPATVTDGKGRFIDGLRESDFVLLDNGHSRPLHIDTSDIAQIPISIVIAVQSNGFSGPALAKIRKVGSMVEPLITGERGEAAVIRFSENRNTPGVHVRCRPNHARFPLPAERWPPSPRNRCRRVLDRPVELATREQTQDRPADFRIARSW
jgi:hypothetical protein